MKETMKKLMEVFITCHFLISVAIGVCGMILGPDINLRYADMFAPTVMAFFWTLPTMLTIQSKKRPKSRLC